MWPIDSQLVNVNWVIAHSTALRSPLIAVPLSLPWQSAVSLLTLDCVTLLYLLPSLLVLGLFINWSTRIVTRRQVREDAGQEYK